MPVKNLGRIGLLELLILSVALSGCGKESPKETQNSDSGKSATATASSEPKPLTAGDIRARKADMVVEPTAWYKEYKADWKNLQKYEGKIVEVSGKLTRVQAEFLDERFQFMVLFQVNFPENKHAAVRSFLLDESEWAKLGIGQEVTVKGEYDLDSPSRYESPTLKNAVVVKAGAETQLRYDTDKLAEEYAADPKKTVEKCQDHTLIVTGEVDTVGEEGVSTAAIDFKAKNGKFVRCLLTKREFEHFKVRKGDKVKVLAVCDPPSLQRNERIGLSQPYFMK